MAKNEPMADSGTAMAKIELQNNLFASRTLPTLPYHFFYTIFFHPCLSPKFFKLGT